MKERPIIFSAPMVRAILEGRKTQTRRIVKFPKWADSDGGVEFSGADGGPAMLSTNTGCFADVRYPYGAPGDRLWVRETWRADSPDDPERAIYRATYSGEVPRGFKWKPSIYMPRWASRITLEVTGVRVQKLWEITEADAEAEGVEPGIGAGQIARYVGPFRTLWGSINGGDSAWMANPWVWVVEFKRVSL